MQQERRNPQRAEQQAQRIAAYDADLVSSNDFSALIELNDADEVLREIDRLCERRCWDDLAALRRACHLATDRGKQLWGAAGHAEYRLALEADAPHAAIVLDTEPIRFALGPLPEVAATTHSWDELAPHVHDGPCKGTLAYERVVHGEDLSGRPELQTHRQAFEMPLALQDWEPPYSTAIYTPHGARFPTPSVTVTESLATAGRSVERVEDTDSTDALAALSQAWTQGSNGTADIVAVEGDALNAAAALGVVDTHLHRISFTDALALMAWAGASGGAHGRRAGAAAGRAKAWWATVNLADAQFRWPLDPDEVGDLGTRLVWWTWGLEAYADGWALRLVIDDPDDGVAFAVDATDHGD